MPDAVASTAFRRQTVSNWLPRDSAKLAKTRAAAGSDGRSGHRSGRADLVTGELLEFVLTQPPDRVSYRQLDPTDEDMRTIMHYAIRTGILRDPIDLGDLVDRRFIPEHIQPIGIATE